MSAIAWVIVLGLALVAVLVAACAADTQPGMRLSRLARRAGRVVRPGAGSHRSAR
ncbi:hypothetical protein [Streptomyces sp. NPDC088789]|uniref:hypothetical protein n=1 Tax=Streptomyces sp. NPDC088789 TaxID=3365899 RepID=UPI00382467D7